jgi:integrase
LSRFERFTGAEARTWWIAGTSRLITAHYHEARQPLPVNVELLRAALMSDDPARAALVALVAFHGLRAGQLQRLQLTDVRDGRLHVEGRVIVLAEPVRERLRAYLDIRQRRWPDTANPHLSSPNTPAAAPRNAANAGSG